MIEVLLKEYLDNHLDVPSFFEFEDYMPNSFVLIEKTSGRYSNHQPWLFKVMEKQCMQLLC